MIRFNEGETNDLDAEFPLGDGTAQTGASAWCPYCAEPVELSLDPGSGASQSYVEDCSICCRPWSVTVRYGPDGDAVVDLEPLE